MLQVTKEILSGVSYYEAEDQRGNVTTVWTHNGNTFVMTNRSPAKLLTEVKRLSKTAKALIDYMAADKEIAA